MFTKPVSSILYCYEVYQDYFDEIKTMTHNIEFHEGLPTLEKVQSLNDDNFNIIILDDLMEHIVKSIDTQILFTKYCHHYNITAIF